MTLNYSTCEPENSERRQLQDSPEFEMNLGMLAKNA